jgi:hypothetical protein
MSAITEGEPGQRALQSPNNQGTDAEKWGTIYCRKKQYVNMYVL